MERLAFVVRHHRRVYPKAHRSHRLELSRNPEQKLDTSNIYGQFIIDVPIWSPSSPREKPSEQTRMVKVYCINMDFSPLSAACTRSKAQKTSLE